MIAKTQYFRAIIAFPILFIAYIVMLISSNKRDIERDIVRWEINGNYFEGSSLIKKLSLLLVCKREFRNLFYKRIGWYSYMLSTFLPPLRSVSMAACKIGPGFVMIHGFMTIINSEAIIGSNCTIMHNVTIGGGNNGVPIIGDNVTIGAGAIIIGGIKIGNNVKIGAGAVVVDDVPDNSVVVGEKARIIKGF